MRKGFIIDLQSGLNWNGTWNFASHTDAGEYWMPDSASFPYSRKIRIGDMWKVSGSSHTEYVLKNTNDRINAGHGDYLIAIATGSDGYVSIYSASHWEIHRTNPTAGNGLQYTATTNKYDVIALDNYGLVSTPTGVGISGSNTSAATSIGDSDLILFLSGSTELPRKITYQNLTANLQASINDNWTDQNILIDYQFLPADITAYQSQGYLPIIASFDGDVKLSSNTSFHAHISNLFLKVSGSAADIGASEYEIEYVNAIGSDLTFKIKNLKFKLESTDMIQINCFISGSSTLLSVGTGG